jgi:hypothetical protein
VKHNKNKIIESSLINNMQEPGGQANVARETNDAAQFLFGLQSALSGNAPNVAEENGDEISLHPLVPYISMVFDDLEVTHNVYNEYAFKLGFGIHNRSTKYNQA